MTTAEFGALIRKEAAAFKDIVAKANIKAQ
jgi:hypothetical protein